MHLATRLEEIAKAKPVATENEYKIFNLNGGAGRGRRPETVWLLRLPAFRLAGGDAGPDLRGESDGKTSVARFRNGGGRLPRQRTGAGSVAFH